MVIWSHLHPEYSVVWKVWFKNVSLLPQTSAQLILVPDYRYQRLWCCLLAMDSRDM